MSGDKAEISGFEGEGGYGTEGIPSPPPLGSLEDLKEALMETLEYNGTLGGIKAKIRAELFHALEGRGVKGHTDNRNFAAAAGGGRAAGRGGYLPPPLSNDNLLINELIREYLDYNEYHHATSVLLAESGHPTDRSFDRPFVKAELGVTETMGNEGQLPLLYGIVGMLKSWRKDPDNVPAGVPMTSEGVHMTSTGAADEEEARGGGAGGIPHSHLERDHPQPTVFIND